MDLYIRTTPILNIRGNGIRITKPPKKLFLNLCENEATYGILFPELGCSEAKMMETRFPFIHALEIKNRKF